MSDLDYDAHLTDEERDCLIDWWDDEATAAIESIYPIVARMIHARLLDLAQRAEAAEAALRWIADEPSIEDCAPDCMPRAACQRSDLGHMFCGFCQDCNEPRHHCGHTVEAHPFRAALDPEEDQ